MSKKLKPEDVKAMISKNVALKITPVAKRLGSVEETLTAMQEMLKAISVRLNFSPESPMFEAMNSGLENDPLSEAAIKRFPSLAKSNPLIFPENRKKIERVFAKRGFKEGDTIDKVLAEADKQEAVL